MTLDDLVNAIYARGYKFTQDNDAIDNPALIALNSVYRYVCSSQRWPWLEAQDTSLTTTAGTTYYSLSTITDLRQLDAVRLRDSSGTYNLDYMDKQPLETRVADCSGNSLPRYWTLARGELGFFPTPDATYTIVLDYVNVPDDLAALTDVPVLPTPYHDVLVWGAIVELAYRERDYWDNGVAQQSYMQRYKAMQEEYMLRQVQTSSRVKRSGFYDDVDWSPLGWGVDG